MTVLKRIFEAELSTRGIAKLIKELKHYQNVTLPSRCKELAMRLAEVGVQVVDIKIDESPLGRYISVKTDVKREELGFVATLIVKGETFSSDKYEDFNTLLAIEFGAGIHYNPLPNPYQYTQGFGVGSFPGQIHAFEDGWYFWDEEYQTWKYTHGVKATMPMYEAKVKILRNVQKIAKQVFSK